MTNVSAGVARFGEAPPVPGFIESQFSPLVKAVVDACVTEAGGVPGERTGILLVTTFGDSTTTDTASRRQLAGQVHNPLLFYQSVPTSILGHVTREHRITGPICCISVLDSPISQALEMAAMMIADGDIEQVLLIAVELAATERVFAAWQRLAGVVAPPARDGAVAMLVRAASDDLGHLGSFASLAVS
jgi:3-oxoacyl-(acyl-carrier-protein) synthase